MSQFARGTHSRAMCDRCGQKYPYRQLFKEWTGLKVCRKCWEPRHEQLDPIRHVYDPQALHEPRPDNDNDGGVATQLSEIVPGTHGDRGV